MKKPLFVVLLLALVSYFALAQNTDQKPLQVLTSTNTLKSLTKLIGGTHVQVESLVPGPQDPHYISAKPSYMLKARKADLLVFVGMDLEVGWLPNIITGARNPHIQQNQKGSLNASQFIKALSVPTKKVDRFFGDIHPHGNPHYLLDPLRAVRVSKGISQRLSQLDPINQKNYLKNHEIFKKEIESKVLQWNKRIQESQVKKIVSYHSSFEYFLDRFGLQLLGLIEEKPGIPPSAKHLLSLGQKMKQEGVDCILMSHFYNNKRVKKIQQFVKVSLQTVPIEVLADKQTLDYFLLIEALVQAIENCGNFKKQT